MRIEGHFTASEIRSAVALGATTDKLPYKKIRINFPNQAAYDRWFTAQQKTQAWGTLLLLAPKPGQTSGV
jgi:hypothetical protein